MPILFDKPLRGSDLILKEIAPFQGYTRADTTVDLVAGQTLQLGAILFREKAAAPANYEPLTSAADLTVDNEFAVYYADQLGEILPTTGAGEHTVESLVLGNLILKDKPIYDAVEVLGLVLTDAQKDTLKNLLHKQGIVVEKVLGV